MVIVGAGNGGGKHWLEGVERRAPRSWDMHELGKFHAMLAADSTCHIRSKGQTEGYGPLVNHIRPCLGACVFNSIHMCWSGLEWNLV
jgi:hypothetical protein